MIEGWDPPTSDGYLSYRIAAAIAQVGNASVNDQFEGGVCTELDSHVNMCVLGSIACYCLSWKWLRQLTLVRSRNLLEV